MITKISINWHKYILINILKKYETYVKISVAKGRKDRW